MAWWSRSGSGSANLSCNVCLQLIHMQSLDGCIVQILTSTCHAAMPPVKRHAKPSLIVLLLSAPSCRFSGTLWALQALPSCVQQDSPGKFLVDNHSWERGQIVSVQQKCMLIIQRQYRPLLATSGVPEVDKYLQGPYTQDTGPAQAHLHRLFAQSVGPSIAFRTLI